MLTLLIGAMRARLLELSSEGAFSSEIQNVPSVSRISPSASMPWTRPQASVTPVRGLSDMRVVPM